MHEPETKEKTCIVCGERCAPMAEGGKRWSWGPDGMHCHFECEQEFIRRYPHLVPEGHRMLIRLTHRNPVLG